MRLAAGATIGIYEVVSALGRGGMGEVYRARDTRLRRDVALKVLPEDFAADAGRLSRFQREAEVLASLNHPNIAAIYGLEESGATRALVLELVEGATLADRLARGPLPLDQSLNLARQIAEALEAAHERGIVHRDLKPANIALTPAGTVKVLDFGLAKAFSQDGADTDASVTPTMTSTMPGTVMGTPSYMSPEQATGGEVDRATDVWAFGCVLYEMLTGRVSFDGGTAGDILANVLKTEPDWQRLPADTPDSVRRLLRRSLEKDRKRRLRDVHDARLELDDATAASPPERRAGSVPSRRRERLAWTAAVAVCALFAAAFAVQAFRPAVAASEVRFEFNTPPGPDSSVAISPDGLKIVYAGTSDGSSRLWLRELASPVARPLAGTERGMFPFWSPDNRAIGFFADGALKRVDLDGGSARTLASPTPAPFGAAWSADGTILFSANPGSPILRIPAEGGEAVAATRITPAERSQGFPRFLPDGRHFLFFVTGSPDARGVHLGALGMLDTQRLIDADGPADTTAAGSLLFLRQGTVWAQDLDVDNRALLGAPVDTGIRGNVSIAASPAGPIAFRTPPPDSGRRRFAWIDRAGTPIREVEYTDTAAVGPSLSNDGRHLAVFRFVDGNMDIWSFGTERDTWDRVTFDPGDDIHPVWSPDGTELVFGSRRGGRMDLYRTRPGGGPGSDQLLLSTPAVKFPMDWSRDGRFLLYGNVDPKRGLDIWALPLNGPPEPFPVVQTEFNEEWPQFSPDGRWVAYQSDRTGRFEVYVRPFPGPGVDVPVSNQGGSQVRWHPDGGELFYVSPDDQLMSVAIRFSADGTRAEPVLPSALFAANLQGGNGARQRYAVMPDGRSFVMNTDAGLAASLPVTVVLNWKPPGR